MSRKRYAGYEAEINVSNNTTKRSRKDLNQASTKPERSTIEQRKKKVETEWRKAILQQYTEKEANFQAEIDQIKDDSHPEVQAYLKQLKQEKQHKLAILHTWKENQLRSILDSTGAEKMECVEEYQVAVGEIRDQLLGICYQEQNKVDKERFKRERRERRIYGREQKLKKIARKDQTLIPKKQYEQYEQSKLPDHSIIMQIKSMSILPQNERADTLIAINQAIKEIDML